MSPDVSVCIPSIGRPSLGQTIKSIREASAYMGGKVEIVVALYGSGPHHVGDREGSAIFVSGSPGAAGNRNIAATRAGGKWLLFIDDDCVLRNDYFSVLGELLASADPFPIAGFAGLTARQGGDCALARSWAAAGFDYFFSLPWQSPYLRWSPTANLVVRREAFELVGGFRQMGQPCGGEDVDFGMRLARLGLLFRSAPAMLAFHTNEEFHDRPDEARRKAYRYGWVEQYLADLFPEACVKRGQQDAAECALRRSFLQGGQDAAAVLGRPPAALSLTRLAVPRLATVAARENGTAAAARTVLLQFGWAPVGMAAEARITCASTTVLGRPPDDHSLRSACKDAGGSVSLCDFRLIEVPGCISEPE
jgi:hypothetical protein